MIDGRNIGETYADMRTVMIHYGAMTFSSVYQMLLPLKDRTYSSSANPESFWEYFVVPYCHEVKMQDFGPGFKPVIEKGKRPEVFNN